MKELTLYGLSSNDKVKIWKIKVDINADNTANIIVTHGYIDGKLQVATTKILNGKNIGRSNETTAYTQACKEAESKYNKQIDKGYQKTKEIIKNDSNKPMLPMLALKFTERSKDVKYPCFVQPKLDGVRCVYNYKNKTLNSRTGKVFPELTKILNELKLNDIKYYLDGELYGYNMTFQETVGLIQKKKKTQKDIERINNIKYIVYDIILDVDYIERKELLEDIFKSIKDNNYIDIITTEICNSKKEIPGFLKKYEDLNFEGLIIRNKLGRYKLKDRSSNLLKLKTFVDAEFEIIDFKDGTGKEEGAIIWVCKTKENKTFDVRPIGTYDDRKVLFKNGNKYIGKFLTVKFKEYTPDKIPREPVGINIRDYE